MIAGYHRLIVDINRWYNIVLINIYLIFQLLSNCNIIGNVSYDINKPMDLYHHDKCIYPLVN